MDLISRISENFSESAHLKLQCMDTLAAPIAAAAHRMVDCLKADGKILSCGNGGSAGDSQHFAAELVGRFERAFITGTYNSVWMDDAQLAIAEIHLERGQLDRALA